MSKYRWKDEGPQPRVEAQVFGEIVETLSDGDAGAVKPGMIVDAARTRRSPIHALFEWDDGKAAEGFRIQQARQYLGRLQIVRVQVRDGPQVSSRAFFSVRMREQKSYVSQGRILSDVDLRKQVLEAACNELQVFIRKFGLTMALGSYVPRLQEVLSSMLDEAGAIAEQASTSPKPRRIKSPRTAPAAAVDVR